MNKDLNIQQVVDEGLCPSVQNSIKKIVEKAGFIRHKICTKLISSEGGNYLGVLYEIDIKGETGDGKNEEINIFVKQVIPNGDTATLFSISEIYNNEIFIYTELAARVAELQNIANIPMEEQLKFVKIYNLSSTDALLFENIAKQGFKTFNRMDAMKLDFAELCMEQLAKFHGLGFLIEIKNPEYFESKIKSMKQKITIDADYKEFMNNVYQSATRILSPDLKIKTDKWWKSASEDYPKYYQGIMTDGKCLCHGDFKTNNIMYKETEGVITEVIAIDYQLAHYGSPVLDLIYFICMGTDQKFRRNHLEHLKDHYHDSLRKYLEYFNVLVDDVYPRKIFENDFKTCYDFALVTSICLLPFIMTPQEEITDFGNLKHMHTVLKFSDSYYDRLIDAFEDFLI